MESAEIYSLQSQNQSTNDVLTPLQRAEFHLERARQLIVVGMLDIIFIYIASYNVISKREFLKNEFLYFYRNFFFD